MQQQQDSKAESMSARAEYAPSLSSQSALAVQEGAALQATPQSPQAVPNALQATPDSPLATPNPAQATPDSPHATPESPQQQQQKTALLPAQQPLQSLKPKHTAASATAKVHFRRCCACCCVGVTSHAVQSQA